MNIYEKKYEKYKSLYLKECQKLYGGGVIKWHLFKYNIDIYKIIQIAKERNSHTIHNEMKITKRRELIEKGDLKLLLFEDTDCIFIKDTLAQYRFISMTVAPQSSIARKISIQGSDIDAGIIVTEKNVDEHIQKKIIEYFRGRGFECYHESESSEAKSKGIIFRSLYDIRRLVNDTYKIIDEYMTKHGASAGANIQFATRDNTLFKLFGGTIICGDNYISEL